MIFEEKEIQEVDHIMGKIQDMPQFLIFSATISKGLRAFLNKYLQNKEHTYCITMQKMIDYGCLEEKNVKDFTDESYENMFVKAVNNGKYFEYYLTDTCQEK